MKITIAVVEILGVLMKELFFKHIKDKLDTSEFAVGAKFIKADDLDLSKELVDKANTYYVVDADMNADAMNSVFKLAGKLHASKVLVVGRENMDYYFGDKRHFYKIKEIKRNE